MEIQISLDLNQQEIEKEAKYIKWNWFGHVMREKEIFISVSITIIKSASKRNVRKIRIYFQIQGNAIDIHKF